MSYSDNLTRAGLPTMRTLTRRILATWQRATSSDIEAGARWYGEAESLVTELASDTVTREQAAAVVAHLSPRTTWTRNVAGAAALVRHGERGPGIMAANHDRAAAALTHPDPESTFGGPKTLRFFRNILGDSEAVTVDVWAARVAGVSEKSLSRKGIYDAVEHAYRRAARRVGVSPATMQATTWVVARNGRAT